MIVPGRSAPLFQRDSLRLGGVELVFLQACAFEHYVRTSGLRSQARLTRGG